MYTTDINLISLLVPTLNSDPAFFLAGHQLVQLFSKQALLCARSVWLLTADAKKWVHVERGRDIAHRVTSAPS